MFIFECGLVSIGLDLVEEAGPTVGDVVAYLTENYDDVTFQGPNEVLAVAK